MPKVDGIVWVTYQISCDYDIESTSNAIIVDSIPVVYIVNVVNRRSVKYSFIVTNMYFAEEYDPGRVPSLSGSLIDEFDFLIDSLIDDRGDYLAEKMLAVSFDDKENS
jgi:hypothetical protein